MADKTRRILSKSTSFLTIITTLFQTIVMQVVEDNCVVKIGKNRSLQPFGQLECHFLHVRSQIFENSMTFFR